VNKDDNKEMKRDTKIYQDYANEEVTESAEEQSYVEEHRQHQQSNRSEHNFPVKLHYMLSELENDGVDGIISVVALSPTNKVAVCWEITSLVSKQLLVGAKAEAEAEADTDTGLVLFHTLVILLFNYHHIQVVPSDFKHFKRLTSGKFTCFFRSLLEQHLKLRTSFTF
jgi:hypothetical protein